MPFLPFLQRPDGPVSVEGQRLLVPRARPRLLDRLVQLVLGRRPAGFRCNFPHDKTLDRVCGPGVARHAREAHGMESPFPRRVAAPPFCQYSARETNIWAEFGALVADGVGFARGGRRVGKEVLVVHDVSVLTN